MWYGVCSIRFVRNAGKTGGGGLRRSYECVYLSRDRERGEKEIFGQESNWILPAFP